MKDSGRDITGLVFGELTALTYVGKLQHNQPSYLCVCSCGKEHTVKKAKLTSGYTKSCGCLRSKTRLSVRIPRRLLNAYNHMISRCYNVDDGKYHRYGGRGIRVCDLWKNDRWEYYEWALSNGYAKNLQCDRIDNNKGYSPTNCQYLTNRENSIKCGKQSNNTSGYIGVQKMGIKWESRVKVYGKTIRLGLYISKIAAAIVRDAYIINNDLRYHLNFHYVPHITCTGWVWGKV